VWAAKPREADIIIGVGGGSVLMQAKRLPLATNAGDIFDYLGVIGEGNLWSPHRCLVAIPTTAGTGAEVTRNAVLKHQAECQSKPAKSSDILQVAWSTRMACNLPPESPQHPAGHTYPIDRPFVSVKRT
jgi:alcohol dehydrogenase class IV